MAGPGRYNGQKIETNGEEQASRVVILHREEPPAAESGSGKDRPEMHLGAGRPKARGQVGRARWHR